VNALFITRLKPLVDGTKVIGKIGNTINFGVQVIDAQTTAKIQVGTIVALQP